MNRNRPDISKNTARLVVVGSSNTDLVLVCARLPKPGETLAGGEFRQFAGGKGANQAVAAARAGARVVFVGARGKDAHGEAAKRALRFEGISTRHFTVHTGVPSGIALILIGGTSRQNLIAVARSANDALSPKQVALAEPEIRRAGAVVAQLEVPLAAVTAAARLAATHGKPFILNPAPARHLPRTLLRQVHTLVPNEREATLLTGETVPEKAARALRKMGCRNVVVTLGKDGALAVSGDGEWCIRAPRVKPVDTVGAGDCFIGWLATGIARGQPLHHAVELAVRAASIAVTREGAQAGMPFARDLP